MTREYAKLLVPVITAFAEGKQLQIRCYDGKYYDTDILNETEDLTKYRIKPEPTTIERWAIVYRGNQVYSTFASEHDAQSYLDECGRDGDPQVVKLTGTLNPEP